jgi:hypothetical protein
VETTCETATAHFVSVPGMREELEFGVGPGAAAEGSPYRKAFLRECQRLPSEAVRCAMTMTDLASSQACTELSRASTVAAQASMPAPRRSAAVLTEAAAEVESMLRVLATDLEAQAREHPDFQPPGSTPLTPAQPCCATADGRCLVEPSQWQHPTWRRLAFQPSQPFRFQYRVTTEGKGADAVTSLEAVGDPFCDGHAQRWVLALTRHDGAFSRVMWEPTKVE